MCLWNYSVRGVPSRHIPEPAWSRLRRVWRSSRPTIRGHPVDRLQGHQGAEGRRLQQHGRLRVSLWLSAYTLSFPSLHVSPSKGRGREAHSHTHVPSSAEPDAQALSTCLWGHMPMVEAFTPVYQQYQPRHLPRLWGHLSLSCGLACACQSPHSRT
jgi:hypothetical protein